MCMCRDMIMIRTIQYYAELVWVGSHGGIVIINKLLPALAHMKRISIPGIPPISLKSLAR